jgi:signal transduction histidine kinase
MEERDGRQDDRMLLTQEEEASLRLLEPLFARHRDRIFEILPRDAKSDSDGASLLSDDLAVAQLKRSQQEYLFSLLLLNGQNGDAVGGDGAEAAEYRDPFGLGPGRQLQTFVHFLTSIQPLVFDAFGAKPRLYHRVWTALLKVVFRELDLVMRESLTQREELVAAARRDASESRRALDQALDKQMFEERQRQAEHRTVVNLLTTWLTKTSELAQAMGTPLNVILGRAESLLEKTEDDRTQAALQSIVRQVEQLIPLRRQLCALDHGFNSKLPAPDRETMKEGPRAGC